MQHRRSQTCVGDRHSPAPAWTGVRPANKYGPNSVQGIVFGDIDPFAVGVSEDCLYLNVWAGAECTTNELQPVLFWIHGGGFVVGAGSEPRLALPGPKRRDLSLPKALGPRPLPRCVLCPPRPFSRRPPAWDLGPPSTAQPKSSSTALTARMLLVGTRCNPTPAATSFAARNETTIKCARANVAVRDSTILCPRK